MSYELIASAERSDSPRLCRPERRSMLRARHSSTLSTMPGAKKADGWSIMANSTAYMTRHTRSSSAATACHKVQHPAVSHVFNPDSAHTGLTPHHVADTLHPVTCFATDLYE